MTIAKKLTWATILIALLVTWLPCFNILNSPIFIGPFPQPLAVTLLANVVLTACVFVLYRLYFRPVIARERAESAKLN
ncbi:hypothetical protein J2X53_004414 [Pseudorhodobacter sp. 4114]|nr:hypothetical protein [Pseudorhodobacter sp. 4114]